MAQFRRYEDDLIQLLDGVKRKISEVPGQESNSARKQLAVDTEADLEEAEEMLDQMEIQSRQSSGGERSKMTLAIKQYKDDLQKYRTELKKALQTADRAELLGPRSSSTLDEQTYDQREQLLNQTRQLEGQKSKISSIHQTALETEAVGQEVLVTMAGQREQMLRTRDTLHGVDEDISRARGILRRIARRIIGNKLLLIFIILLFLGILGVIIYFAAFYHPGDPVTPPTNSTRIMPSLL